MNIVILERDSVGTDIDIDGFNRFGFVTSYANTLKTQAAKRIKDADIVISNKTPMNEDTLKDAKNIRLICLFATGYDMVDLDYCKSRGITVCNVCDYCTDAVAQHTFALTFFLLENCLFATGYDMVDLDYCKSRGITVCNVCDYCTDAVAQHTFALTFFLLEKLRHYDDYVKSGQYGAQQRFSNFDFPYYELAGKTWGIIGMGHIGRRVASIASAFGCKVIFYSASGNSTCTDYERTELIPLLESSDIISLHCPLSDKTFHLIDDTAFCHMRPSSILINVARGPVVDNKALHRALTNNRLMAAGLDVLEGEPITPDNPLADFKDSTRLIITPHMAWASTEARQRVVDETINNVEAFLSGHPRNVV